MTALFLTSFALSLLILGIFILRFRLLNHQRIIAKKYLLKLQKQELPYTYFSSAVIAESKHKFWHLTPQKITILKRAAMKSVELSAPLIRNAVKHQPQNAELLLLDAEISLLLNHRQDFLHLIEQIRLPRFCPRYLKARYKLLAAKSNLYQTDMLSASVAASLALKIYQRLGFAYEEAECYATLAQIYRISGVFDVAFTMLKDAKKIYKKLKLFAKVAEAEAYFGLIEIGRENYSAATEYLESAKAICQKHNLIKTEADICNWQGLTALLTNDLTAAHQEFTTALKNTQSLSTRSFAFEMLARLYFQKKDYKKALTNTDSALKLYQESHHKAGIFETLYLKAEIFYIKQDYDESRRILTALIKEKTPPSAIYYPANAYTLLGAVELKNNNPDKARTLFKQAADLEHALNRLKGAAIDYNNLAELERLNGDNKTAQTYLKQALCYAEEIGDNELKSYLKTKLK